MGDREGETEGGFYWDWGFGWVYYGVRDVECYTETVSGQNGHRE